MSPTHDLRHALGAAADHERPPADPAADLARARHASRARLRRRVRLGLSGLACTVVLAVGSVTVLDDERLDDPRPGDQRAAPTVAVDPGIRLVAERLDASPYTFDLTPAGWSVQGQRPSTVTIAPDDGSTSSHPDDFRGKLVILFDANPTDGRVVERDGRRFWIRTSEDYTTVATRTVAGEPEGVVRIQYPADVGWDVDSMVAFLASVHVGPLAQHGLG